MTLLDPKTDPAPVDSIDAQALIKEARRLRRRRWSVGLLVAAVVGAAVGFALTAASHGPSSPAPKTPRRPVSNRDVRPVLSQGPFANLSVAGPLAVAPGGALYVADVASEQVLVRLPNGLFRVIAGDGRKGVSGDGGQAIDAEFLDIEDMAVGPDGSLYVVDGDRVRVVSPNGVISTLAGKPGVPAPPRCCSSTTLPPLIRNGTPARSVSIDQLNSAAIALSERGVLYISTGMQILRLDAGKLDVITAKATGLLYRGQSLGRLGSLGQIAVDSEGNVIVSGGAGWAIWQVEPNGVATEVTGENARRSGGDTSVLERAPDGVVYGESGGRFLKVQGNRAIPAYAFPSTQTSYFWLTYFAFGPGGTIYADEIPGGGGFEMFQQLRVVSDNSSSVLWQQTPADVDPVAS